MKILPKFLKKVDIEKYSLEVIDFDLEKEFNNIGISITSWGRPNFPEEKSKKYEFSDYKFASKIIKEIISKEKSAGKLIIVWSNANLAEIKSNHQFLEDYIIEIITEDWDCWIFGENWIIEKYHEGELVFFKN